MRALKYVRICLWSVLMAVPACSSPGSDPGDPDGSMPDGTTSTPDGGLPDAADPDAPWDGDIDEPCADYARSDCNYLNRCSPIYVEMNYGSYAGCVAQSKKACTVLSTAPGTSWTPPALLACAKAGEPLGCYDDTYPAACVTAPGAKEKGASCVTSSQCASTFCIRERYNNCGVCGDKAPDGASCTRGLNCQSGRCTQRICSPMLKEGDPCSRPSDCPWNLACSDGTCKKPTYAPLGQPCDNDLLLCESDYLCEDSVCSKGKFVDLGDRCGIVDGHYTYCRGSECSDMGVCVNYAPEGAACPLYVTCAGGGLCVNGFCKAYAPDTCETPNPSALTADTRELADDQNIGRRAHRAHLLNVE
jgi:hypothetical protein